MLADLTELVTDIVNELGYLGVALLVAVENVFPPIPSEVVLPFAGFVARDGDASLLGMITAATAGSIAGAWVLYGIAATVGEERLHTLVRRHGKWFRLTEDDLVKAEQWFDRRAVIAVTAGRCVPLIRSLVSIPAGFRRMPLVRFTLYTLLGSAVWNTGLIGAGYLLRDNWEVVERYMSFVQYVVLAVIAVVIGRFILHRFVLPRSRAS